MYHKQNNMALHKIEGSVFDWMPSTLISNVLFYYCLMQKDSKARWANNAVRSDNQISFKKFAIYLSIKGTRL